MICDFCDTKMRRKEATNADPYPYLVAGLKTFLVGIQVHQCTICRTEVPAIPKIASLHTVIAKNLFFKPALLTGSELRFLRKNAGLASNEFAALVGITPAHISRVENGKTEHLGKTADKFARMLSVLCIFDKDAHQILKKLSRKITVKKRQPTVVFEMKGDQWQVAA